MLEFKWAERLQNLGVRLPKEGSVARQTLEKLYSEMGNWVSKETLDAMIGKDNQNGRHLGYSSGWNIEAKTIDGLRHYKLKDVDNTHPRLNKESKIRGSFDFESLKSAYGNRCASCGSVEGKTTLDGAQICKLEEGHMDPNKPLTIDNCIPQCTVCNKTYRDKFIFDNHGRVKTINPNSKNWK